MCVYICTHIHIYIIYICIHVQLIHTCTHTDISAYIYVHLCALYFFIVILACVDLFVSASLSHLLYFHFSFLHRQLDQSQKQLLISKTDSSQSFFWASKYVIFLGMSSSTLVTLKSYHLPTHTQLQVSAFGVFPGFAHPQRSVVSNAFFWTILELCTWLPLQHSWPCIHRSGPVLEWGVLEGGHY